MPTDIVYRLRLHRRLSAALDYALILVTAPAGFGKSTLLSAWLDTYDLPHAWVTVDEADNELPVFLGYLAAAVQTINPDALSKTRRFLAGSDLPPLNVVVRTLVNELSEIGRDFILVLDDFHTIRQRVILELLSCVLQHPPQNMHLVVSTRLEPALPLAGYRARNAVLEMRGDDLLFSKPEMATLVEQSLGMSVAEDALSVLADRTTGWAAGIRLALLALRSTDDINKELVEFPVENRYVIDYWSSEVLAQVPPPVRDFLFRTSILDQIHASLAKALIDDDVHGYDAQECLDWLKRANMFVEYLDPHGEWYRYHELFRTLLSRERTQHLRAEEVHSLHRRAGAWYASHNYLEQALRHMLAGQDTPGAVRLVAQHRHHLLSIEQRPRLGRLLRQFPDADIARHPDLLLAKAWIALLGRADTRTVLELVGHAQTLVDELALEPQHARRIQGEIDTLNSIEGNFAANDPPNVISLATRALDSTPQEWYLVRSEAWLHLALAFQMSGQLDRCLAVLAEGMQEDRVAMAPLRARVLGSSGFIHWIAADLRSLLQVTREWMEVIKKGDLSESFCWGNYFLASANYQTNDLPTAEFHAKLVEERRYTCHRITVVQCAIISSLIHQARGETDEAQVKLDHTEEYLSETQSEALRAVVQAFRAELGARQGDFDSAGRWAATVGPRIPLGLMGFSYAPALTLPKVLLAMNTPASRRQAAAALARLHAHVTRTHNTRFAIDVLAMQAVLHHAERDERAALQAMEQALALAQPGGFIRVFADLGPSLAPVLAGLRQGSADDLFVDQILEALHYETASAPPGRMPDRFVPTEAFTRREIEVLELLAQRLTDKEIAGKLFISPRTVGRHAANLYQKLGVSNRREAVVAARSLGML